MKKLFTLIILLASTATFAQNYFPLVRPNLVWQVMHGYTATICFFEYGEQNYFQGDTLVSGYIYQKIYFNPIISLIGNPFCPPYAVSGTSQACCGLMREDTIARKVFMYNYNSNSEELLYDFNLVAGDTLNSISGMWLIVDSVSTISLPNIGVRKIFYLNSGENYIESIGGSNGIGYPLSNAIGYTYEPICISENNIPIWGGCFGTVGINENLQESKKVYPNPFVNEVTFKVNHSEETEIIMYNGISNEIFRKSFSNSTTINTENFESGIYVYKMIGKSGLSSFGKLVKL